jgi:hypothetical protein
MSQRLIFSAPRPAPTKARGFPRATMTTPIYSLPFHSIAQMRAVAGLLRAYIDDNAPDTNEGADWTPPADLPEVSAAACHLDAGIASAERIAEAEAATLVWHADPGYRLRNDAPGCVTYSAVTRAGAWARYDAAQTDGPAR